MIAEYSFLLLWYLGMNTPDRLIFWQESLDDNLQQAWTVRIAPMCIQLKPSKPRSAYPHPARASRMSQVIRTPPFFLCLSSLNGHSSDLNSMPSIWPWPWPCDPSFQGVFMPHSIHHFQSAMMIWPTSSLAQITFCPLKLLQPYLLPLFVISQSHHCPGEEPEYTQRLLVA